MIAGLLLLAAAISVRLLQYLANTSLSLDEAALALNVLHRPYSDLFAQLDFNQGAPPAFLVLEKIAVDVFGGTEFALRAVPFAAGIFSIFLVIPLIRRFVSGPIAALSAFALFGLSGGLVFFSATGKPYAVDVVTTLALYLLAGELMHQADTRRMARWAVAGAIAIWFSFPAVFVLAGIGSTFIIRSFAVRRWREAAAHLVASCTWLVSFLLLYLVSLRDLGHLERSLGGASGAVGTNPASSTAQTVVGAFRLDLGIGHLELGDHDWGRVAVVAAILLAFMGLARLAKDVPIRAALLATPALFTLVVSELGKYPLFARTLLFLLPAIIVLIGYGVLWIGTVTRALRAIGISAVILVVAFTSLPTFRHMATPQRTSELKPALRFLARQQRSSDTLWVYHATQYALRYYLECKCFGSMKIVRRAASLWPLHPAENGSEQFSPTLKSAPPRFIVSRSVGYSAAYQAEFSALRGRKRVWILISDATSRIRAPLLSYLDAQGRRRMAFRSRSTPTTAAVYLYDLSRRP